MIIGSIRNDKKNYYINLEQKNDKYYYYVVCTSNIDSYILNKEETNSLFKDIFKSKLTFKEKENNYDIYIDEIGNKRYFKNGIEDFYKFFMNNGVDAILYSNKDKVRKSNRARNVIFQNGKLVYKGFVIGFLAATIATAVMYPSNEFPIDIGFYEEKLSEIVEDDDLTIEDVNNYILNSNGDNLDSNKKKHFINEDLFNDVLSISDKSRNYILRKKLEDFGIDYFTEEEKEENNSLSGYYIISNLNTIYLRDDSYDIFNNAAIHEFIHLLQDNNGYHYILEGCAEIIKYEYYGDKINSYTDQVKRIYTLMEIIGPKPIIECNFKGDVSTFEDIIISNLGEEDGKELLDLFKMPPKECDEEINKKIDELLAKMYEKVYGKDISSDNLIEYINSRFFGYDEYNRIYFNQNNESYYKDLNIDFYEQKKVDFSEINKDNLSFYCYYKYDITEDEYNELLKDENSQISIEYKCIDGYNYDMNYQNFLSDDGKYVYNEEEAKERGIITSINYKKIEMHAYESYDEFKNNDQSFYNCIVRDNGIFIGWLTNDKDDNPVLKCRNHITDTIKPISNKFSEQIIKKESNEVTSLKGTK